MVSFPLFFIINTLIFLKFVWNKKTFRLQMHPFSQCTQTCQPEQWSSASPWLLWQAACASANQILAPVSELLEKKSEKRLFRSTEVVLYVIALNFYTIYIQYYSFFSKTFYKRNIVSWWISKLFIFLLYCRSENRLSLETNVETVDYYEWIHIVTGSV